MAYRWMAALDPLPARRWRVFAYAWLAIFFTRLAAWYWIEERWGRP